MLIGIPFGAFNNAYKYGKFPQIQHGLTIGQFFGVSLDFLFNGADKKINKPSTEFRNRFNELVATVKEENDMKKAKILGLPRVVYINACYGFHLPAKLEKQVADFFGVSINYLLGYTDEKE